MWQGCVVNTEWKNHFGEEGSDKGLILSRFIIADLFYGAFSNSDYAAESNVVVTGKSEMIGEKRS
jgi:hypothetical protein